MRPITPFLWFDDNADAAVDHYVSIFPNSKRLNGNEHGADTQDDVDYYWDRLGEGGAFMQCGWLTDRFGVSWQIVPDRMGELMNDPDPERGGRVMQAMLKMVKLDIAQLEAAAAWS
jgi:predicted 3-demethylubiquinone-9 3-methyltransferase (glyoxalase superfamily)